MKTVARLLTWAIVPAFMFSPNTLRADDSVREAQQLLNGLGYDAGPVDGAIGRRTIAAIETFMASDGGAFDGTIDANELAPLRIAAEAIVPTLRFPGRLIDASYGAESQCNALAPSRYSSQTGVAAKVEPVIALNDSISIGGSDEWDSMEPWLKTVLSQAARYDTAGDAAAGEFALSQLEKWAAAGAILGTPVDNAYHGGGNRGTYRPSASAPVLDMENAAQLGYAAYYAMAMLDGLPADRMEPVRDWAARIVDKYGPPIGDAIFEHSPNGIWRLEARPMLVKAIVDGNEGDYHDYVMAYYDLIRHVVSPSGAILKNANRGDRGLHYQSQGLLSIAAVLDIVDNQGGTIPADIEAKFHSAVTFLLDADRDNSKILPLAREGYNNPGDGTNPVRFYRENAEHYWWMMYYISKYPESENAARLRYLISTYDSFDHVGTDMMASVWVPYPINCYRPFDLSDEAVAHAAELVETQFPQVDDGTSSAPPNTGFGGITSAAALDMPKANIIKTSENTGFVAYTVLAQNVTIEGEAAPPLNFEIFTDFSGDVTRNQNLQLFRLTFNRSSLSDEASRKADYLGCGELAAESRPGNVQNLRLHVGNGADKNACILDKMTAADRKIWSTVLVNFGTIIAKAGAGPAPERVRELYDLVN